MAEELKIGKIRYESMKICVIIEQNSRCKCIF